MATNNTTKALSIRVSKELYYILKELSKLTGFSISKIVTIIIWRAIVDWDEVGHAEE